MTSLASAPRALLKKFLELYGTLDRRLLGIFRIYLGLLCFFDVVRRFHGITLFYSNDGLLPNHYALYAPQAKPFFSVFAAFSTPAEVTVAFTLAALCHLCLAAGLYTRVFQIVCFVLVTSLNMRNLLMESGGTVSLCILTTWSLFLPLGDRFSIDAIRRGMRQNDVSTARELDARPEITWPPFVSIAALALTLEVIVIYFFNTVHKTGPTWRTGESFHLILWQNRVATPLAGLLRDHEPTWLSPVLSRVTLVIEGAVPLLILFPWKRLYTRTLNFVLTAGLHLNIAAMMVLGPFSYAMVGINMLMLTPELFDRLSARLERLSARRTVIYDASAPGLHPLARFFAELDSFRHLSFIDRADRERLPEVPLPEGATLVVLDPVTTETWSGTNAVAAAAAALPFGRVLGRLLGALPFLSRWLLDAAAFSPSGRAPSSDAPPAPPAPKPSAGLVLARTCTREVLAGVMLIAVFIQITNDNRFIPAHLKIRQPEVLKPLILYPRILQGWSMFSPDAPRDDGTIIVDGVTADGRHLDPFTGNAPDFDAPLHGPWNYGHLFCNYFLKISFDGNKHLRLHLARYLSRWHEIEKRPDSDKLVSYEVWWVSNDSPKRGSTTPTNIKKRLILSSKDAK